MNLENDKKDIKKNIKIASEAVKSWEGQTPWFIIFMKKIIITITRKCLNLEY